MSDRLRTFRFMLLAGAAVLAACDTPVSPADHFDEEPVGVEIEDLEGNVIATYTLASNVWTFASGNSLTMEAGDQVDVRIFFIAEDGDRFQLPHSDAEHTLFVAIADEDVAAYTPLGSTGEFTALSEGSTSAEVQIYHGAHEDWWTDADLPIQVLPPMVQ